MLRGLFQVVFYIRIHRYCTRQLGMHSRQGKKDRSRWLGNLHTELVIEPHWLGGEVMVSRHTAAAVVNEEEVEQEDKGEHTNPSIIVLSTHYGCIRKYSN